MITSSGCTARQVASKSKSSCAAAYRSSSDRVPSGSAVDADDVLERRAAGPDPVDVLLLADHHFGAGVVEHVGQLFGGQRVVHRERGGAEVLRADFQRIELDPVGHHQRHGVAAADAQPVQTGRDTADVGRVSRQVIVWLPPGVRSATASGSIAAVRWNASHSVVGCTEVVFASVTQPRLVPEYVAGMEIAITDLTPVERTAFVTQYARAVDSRWRRPILGDTLADDIVAKIDYDFDGLGVPASAIRQTALRAKLLDDRVRRFIGEHPDAVIVDLGAGLATPMQRVAPPPTVDWYNVDLPNVIALREQVVPIDDHAHSVAASLADDGWTDQIPPIGPPYFSRTVCWPSYPSRCWSTSSATFRSTSDPAKWRSTTTGASAR